MEDGKHAAGVDARGRSAGAWLASLLWVGGWSALPAVCALWLPPGRAALVAFGVFAAGLLATRTQCARTQRALRAGALRACIGFGLATAAGALALPAWQRGIGQLGLRLGLEPSAALPSPAGVADPALWLAVCCVGPLAEELLFRERLLFTLRAVRPGVAALGSTLLFAAPHLALWSMLCAFLLGLWLVALIRTSQSLLLCVGYHVGINLACLVAGVSWRTRTACLAALLSSWTAQVAALRMLRAPRSSQHAAAGLTALLAAASAAGDVLQFTSRFTIDPFHPSLPPVSVDGSGVAALHGIDGAGALETLSLLDAAIGTATLPVTDPLVSNGGLTAFRIQARPGSGALRPFQPPASSSAPQLTAATLPIPGIARLCFLASCSFGLDMPLAAGTGAAAVGVGVGGAISISPVGTLRRTVLGAPWTLRTASVEVPTSAGGKLTGYASGFAHGPFSFTGSTARAGGSVQLVTPFVVKSPSGLQPPTGFARLTLHFVPEPRALFVLAPSIALLAAGARRRRRRGGSS